MTAQAIAWPDAGELVRRVTIRRWHDIPAAMDMGIVQIYDAGLIRWAKLEPILGMQMWQGEQIGEKPTHRIWVRYAIGTKPADITGEHVVEHDGRRYRVMRTMNVGDAQRFTMIEAKDLGNITNTLIGMNIVLLSKQDLPAVGNVVSMPLGANGMAIIQAILEGASGPVSATVLLYGTNDEACLTSQANAAKQLLKTFMLSGTGAGLDGAGPRAANDIVSVTAPYRYFWGEVTAIAGASAKVTLVADY
jgi:head-tail adaptor